MNLVTFYKYFDINSKLEIVTRNKPDNCVVVTYP